jgi:hypothetical protein
MYYEIVTDTFPANPRDEENLGTIACISNRYFTGDEILSLDKIEALLKSTKHITLPVYAYIHGGIVLNTIGFDCPWDSGQIGCIYIAKDKVRNSFNTKRVNKSLHKKIINYLSQEIEIVSHYLNGDVFGYVIKNDDGNELDSCWGYYGSADAISAAQESMNYLIKNKSKL